MVFVYPASPFRGKHAPWGYERYASYKDWLRDEFMFHCVYCLEREMWHPDRHRAFGVDHIKPKGVGSFRKLGNVYQNMAYACNRCNARKGTILLLDPRRNPFGTHLKVHPDGQIEGLSVEGKELILVLGLDEQEIVNTRIHYLDVYQSFQDATLKSVLFVRRSYFRAFGYPEHMPDLLKKSPKGNDKPLGVRRCCYQRLRGRAHDIAYF